MIVRPQDLLVTLKLACMPQADAATFRFGDLGTSIGMSKSETHAAVTRAVRAQLLVRLPFPTKPTSSHNTIVVNRQNLVEFVVHGARYVFVPERGRMTRGMATAHAAAPLNQHITDGGPPPVWPHADGDTRGESFSPLYRSAVVAARNDETLYGALALIDALRAGRARERKLAAELFERMLGGRGT